MLPIPKVYKAFQCLSTECYKFGTMMTKQKKCKGTGKAIGSGCGNIYYLHKYGLCSDCFKVWLYNTPNGQEMLLNTLKRAKNETQRKVKEKFKQMKAKIETPDKYRARVLQKKINKIARLIDIGLPCICGGVGQRLEAGHFHSVGANRSLALNLHNIHRQSHVSNHWKSGDEIAYRNGLINEYGQDYLDYIEGLKSLPPLNLSLEEMKEVSKRANEVLRTYYPTPLTAKERIEMRNKINNELGIYKNNFLKK